MKRKFLVLMTFFSMIPVTNAELNVYDSAGEKHIFSTEKLLSMPQKTITTKLPWNETVSEYRGITMDTLLSEVNVSIHKQVTFIALNDYKISVPKEDFSEYEPVIAIKENGKLMSIREKGPYWLIFPVSTHPEIDNTDYHAKMIWQIKEVHF